ncbi:MAG: 16S rRNA (adenine(1518)-N(6)/adenine(1519)-N(6))-dimethyltransferase RsmA [Methanobacteriota archaeon]
MDAGGVREALEAMGMRPSKGLGQHFLVDGRMADRHVAVAGVAGDHSVLEIGPGLGVLTERLLPVAKRVIAVETDRRMCARLEERFGTAANFELINADALDIELPKFDLCVSNLPYQISSPITFKLLEQSFGRATLMYQMEFAQRMVARPGTEDYSRLSVGAQHRAACKIEFKVPRSAFWPQPRVDSAVVSIAPRLPAYHVADERLFHDVVRVLFSHRRKKIRTTLGDNATSIGMERGGVLAALEGTRFGDERVERLAPAEIAELANLLNSLKRTV